MPALCGWTQDAADEDALDDRLAAVAINVGGVGLLPHLPLPTKLRTTVLAPMSPEPGETAPPFGDRVEAAMLRTLTDLIRGRLPLLG